MVEIGGVDPANGRKVVVSGHTDVTELAEKFDALMWVRAVSYDVSKTPDGIKSPSPLCITEDSAEGGQVGMDVSNNKLAHWRLIYHSGQRRATLSLYDIPVSVSFAEISAIMPFNMKVSELGEFGLIEQIKRVVSRLEKASPSRRCLMVGIGDDSAVWSNEGDVELATTDTLVQGVHFRPGMISWRELGWKSLAVNVSDIAAMGGHPTYVLVSLSLPGSVEINDILDFYRGMVSLSNRFGMVIAGGNIAQSPLVVITLTVMGTLGRGLKSPLLRSAATPGDLIGVTGNPGLSAAGLRMMATGMGLDAVTARLFRRMHNTPVPRVTEGQTLRESGVRCAIDISDGLIGDLAHICQMSGVSAVVRLENLPVHPRLKSVFPADYLDMALYGGEDYELLFTARPRVMPLVKKKLKCPVTVIGEVIAKGKDMVTVVDSSGRQVPHGLGGWEHFRCGGL